VKVQVKKINALFLLLPGMLPLLFIVFFFLQQSIIRHKMKEKLEEQSLQTITIADNDVRWIKEDEEILVNEKLFDIRTIGHRNGYTVFNGLFDQQETELMERLEEMQRQGPSTDNRLLADFFQWLMSVYHDHYYQGDFYKSLSILNHGKSSTCLSEQFPEINTPPPKPV
jgi:hypothetical protein